MLPMDQQMSTSTISCPFLFSLTVKDEVRQDVSYTILSLSADYYHPKVII